MAAYEGLWGAEVRFLGQGKTEDKWKYDSAHWATSDLEIMAYSKIFIHIIKYHHKLPSLHSFICPNLVLVVGIAVAEVSNEPDEMCLKADDRRIRRRVSISTEGEVLSSTENILTGLPSGVYLLQELCMDSLWQTTGKAEHLLRSSIKLFRL